MDEAVQNYLDVTSYYGQQVEMDNQARVLLPQILRGEAKLDAEVTVFGKLTYLEVHNREMLRAESARQTDDRRKSARLAAILKPAQ